MALEARAEPLDGKLPSLEWRWDAETEILSGGFRLPKGKPGLTGTVELTSADGGIVVLDVVSGAICGLDVVVWPEVEEDPTLTAPAGYIDGRVVLHGRAQGGAVASVELDTDLMVWADPRGSVFHLILGEPRPASVVRAADGFFIEVDAQHRLAGFWLTGVPPAPLSPD